jgi:hypothetical protein
MGPEPSEDSRVRMSATARLGRLPWTGWHVGGAHGEYPKIQAGLRTVRKRTTGSPPYRSATARRVRLRRKRAHFNSGDVDESFP